MAIIKLGCPACGEVDLTAEGIRLQLWRDASRNTYRFECPSCHTRVVKRATARMLLALRDHGVKPDLDDAAPDPAAPPFDYDDLLDFHLDLESDERIAAFLLGASAASAARDPGQMG